MIALVDGERRDPDRALAADDRGMLYGDAALETLRTHGGRPFGATEHIARLERTLKILGIALAVEPGQLAEEVSRAHSLCATKDSERVPGPSDPESVIRIVVTRGRGVGLAPGPTVPSTRLVLASPVDPFPAVPAALTAIVEVGTALAIPGAKTTSYLPAVLAMRRARASGAGEVVFVDRDRRVLEGAGSCILAVRGGTLVAPPLDHGILASTTRTHLLDLAPGVGLRVAVQPLPLEELLSADEALLGSSLRGAIPLVRVGSAKVGSGKPGAATLALAKAYRARAYAAAGSWAG